LLVWKKKSPPFELTTCATRFDASGVNVELVLACRYIAMMSLPAGGVALTRIPVFVLAAAVMVGAAGAASAHVIDVVAAE
jgi:exosortase/archaeosortase